MIKAKLITLILLTTSSAYAAEPKIYEVPGNGTKTKHYVVIKNDVVTLLAISTSGTIKAYPLIRLTTGNTPVPQPDPIDPTPPQPPSNVKSKILNLYKNNSDPNKSRIVLAVAKVYSKADIYGTVKDADIAIVRDQIGKLVGIAIEFAGQVGEWKPLMEYVDSITENINSVPELINKYKEIQIALESTQG